MTMQQRCDQANAFLEVISLKGRQLFYSPVYERTAHFYVNKHQIIVFIDHVTGMQVAPMISTEKWIGFSYGDTARDLVLALTDYIGLGIKVPKAQLEKEWGYSAADMQAVRDAAIKMGILG